MVCAVLPHFLAATARRTLGITTTTPVVVYNRYRVVATCLISVQRGISIGMGLRQARSILPEANYIPIQQVAIDNEVERLVVMLNHFTSLVEYSAADLILSAKRRRQRPYPEQIHLFYIDLERLHEAQARNLTHQIYTLLTQAWGETVRIGLAGTKLAAYVAAINATPIKFLLREVFDYLSSLSILLLPSEEAMLTRLQLLGINSMGQFVALPANAVYSQFGKYGLFAHQLARGIDGRVVKPYRGRQSERVHVVLDEPLVFENALRDVLQRCAEELAVKLHTKGQMGHTMTLLCRLDNNHPTFSSSVTYRHAISQASYLEAALIQLLKRFLIHAAPVIEIEASIEALEPFAGYQLDLFKHGSDQVERMHEVLDSLAMTYGNAMFRWAVPANEENRVLERRYVFQLASERQDNP